MSRYGIVVVVAVVALVAACSVADKTEQGPTIHVVLMGDLGEVTDQDTAPSLFLLSGHTQYSVDVSITTAAGSSTSDEFANYRVDSFATSFAVGATPIADDPSNYTNDGYTDASYTRTAPLLIPASSKGQSLRIHVDATDTRGLASNPVDFSVDLE